MTKSGRGWRGVLGRGKPEAQAEAPDSIEIEGRLWQAHERAREDATSLIEQTAQLLADLAKQQSAVDALREQSRHAQARAHELGASLVRITESFERLRLLALNVGLEGARLGEPSGRILGSVAEEVRVQSEQGVASVADLRGLIDEVIPTWNATVAGVERVRPTDADLRARIDGAQSLAQRIGSAVDDIGTWARRLSDSDPETARILAQATEHARGLVSSLSSLGERARREVIAATIGPSLQPLLRLLGDLPRSSKPEK